MNAQQIARFTFLWTQAQSSVLAFISATVTNFSDAEDILQKVASVAVSKFDQFQTEDELKSADQLTSDQLTSDQPVSDAAKSSEQSSAFTGWAIQIAKFEVLGYLRSLSKDRHKFMAESVDTIADVYAELSGEIDDRRHALAHCVKELKGRSRTILEERYGKGLRTGKIAESIGISPNNVSLILNRTYKQLRICIESKLAMGKNS